MFIRNLHVESSKTKKILLLHSISFSEVRNFNTVKNISIKHASNLRSHCIFTSDDS